MLSRGNRNPSPGAEPVLGRRKAPIRVRRPLPNGQRWRRAARFKQTAAGCRAGQTMQAFLDIFDIYLLEAVVNGILLGGVLALLALGLNLIFGVIDVTWICYAELVM